MPTEPFDEVLDRAGAITKADTLIDLTCPMLREAVNYSTHAFARVVETGPGSIHAAAFAAPVVLFRHAIEVTDAIEVSLSNSCVEPAKLMLRGAFEAMLAVQYVCNADVERRALAWLYNNVRDRILLHEKLRDQEVSDVLAQTLDEEVREQIAQELQRFQILLDAPYLQPVMEEVRKRRPRHWYSLWGGPANLWELACLLDWKDHYQLLYRRWSSATHATSGLRKTFRPGQRSIVPLRSPEDMIEVAKSARSFLLHALLVVVNRFRPGEEASRAEWYKTEVRPLVQRLHETEVGPHL